MDKSMLISRIKAAAKKEPCDLVIKNVNIVNVFGNDVFLGDVGIKDGYIIGIGDYEGREAVDGSGKFICPGLIDAHAHIESSLVAPDEYYKIALLHGVTSMVADPHEIANVLGTEGIEVMMELAEGLSFDFYFMLPSCVPATDNETSGAVLESEDLQPFYNKKMVLGLAEMMNYPGVMNCDDRVMDKILDAANRGLVIDGHGAGFDTTMINAYGASGITTDHECHNASGVIDRLRRGMYVLMREGTVAKNLEELVKSASISNSRRICLCTDDRHIDDLINEGSIDNSVRIAIRSGLKPETAVQMGTLNIAECYNLRDKGAIAPGFAADFVLLDNLEEFKINSVYKNGRLVVKNNQFLCCTQTERRKLDIKNSVKIKELKEEDFVISLKDKELLNIIEIIPNKLESRHVKINLMDSGGMNEFNSIINEDLIKVAVVERHRATGNLGIGVIKGLGIREGAIATTIAHDSHNMIICGTNDKDMIYAANELQKLGGGIIVVKDEKVLSSLQLEIGGIITGRSSEEVMTDLNHLHEAVKSIAPEINFNPFLTLSFLALPVIPDLRITDKGLFQVEQFRFIDVAE